MATVHHIPTNLGLVERDGAVTEFTRELLVTGLTSTGPDVLSEALATSGVPAYNTASTDFSNTILVGRTPTIVPGEATKVNIQLHYIAKGDDEINFRFRGATSLTQQTRSTDYYGIEITTEHTYPSDDPDYGDQTITQGGEIHVLAPQTRIYATGLLQRNRPWDVSTAWDGYLNSTVWGGGAVGTWLCSDVSFVPHNYATNPVTWKFTFEFTFQGEGWLDIVVFQDPRTGKPPPNLVAGTGWKPVAWHPYRNFNDLFPI